jgi:hypothetical protein
LWISMKGMLEFRRIAWPWAARKPHQSYPVTRKTPDECFTHLCVGQCRLSESNPAAACNDPPSAACLPRAGRRNHPARRSHKTKPVRWGDQWHTVKMCDVKPLFSSPMAKPSTRSSSHTPTPPESPGRQANTASTGFPLPSSVA